MKKPLAPLRWLLPIALTMPLLACGGATPSPTTVYVHDCAAIHLVDFTKAQEAAVADQLGSHPPKELGAFVVASIDLRDQVKAVCGGKR